MMRWLRRVLGRRTNLVMVSCGLLLSGLLLGRFGWTVSIWWAVLFGVTSLLLLKKPVFHFILFSCAAFTLGLWRGSSFMQTLQPYEQIIGQKVIVEATAAEDAVYAENGQLYFMVSEVRVVSPVLGRVPGKMRIKGYGELAVYRGDKLTIEGKAYQARGAAQAGISYAVLQRTGSNQNWLDDVRQRLSAGMMTALPEPLASFGLGLIIGQRSTLPDDVAESLKMVGLTHIVAVSGYNVTILLNASRRMLEKRSKRLTVIAGTVLMLVFLGLTAGNASIVRAVVVSSLMLAAWYYGRNVRPMVILLLAAAVTAVWSPLYLWSDVGWWLSFLAFFGILMLAPQITRRMYKEKKPPQLVQIAIETLSAELMTIPVIMMLFGQLSLVGLLANVLVAGAIPLAMLFSFVASVAGELVPLLCGWFAWPARLVLSYMIDVATMLSRIPHVFHTGTYLSAVDTALCYIALLGMILLLYAPRNTWLRITAKLPQDTQEKICKKP